MEYKQLVTEFAASLGISDIAFDEEGVVRFEADGMLISLMEDEPTRSLIIWSPVATPPPGNREQLFALMFEAMFMGRATRGATFSSEKGEIFLHRRDALVELDVESLSKIVEDFLNTLEQWRRIIENYRPEELREDAAASVDANPTFGSNGFMQV